MANPGAGHEYPPFAVSWLKRDALLFAATSIGCSASSDLHFLYELHPNFAVFPTLPHHPALSKHTDQDVVDFYMGRSWARSRSRGCPSSTRAASSTASAK